MSDSMMLFLYVNLAFIILHGLLAVNDDSSAISDKIALPLRRVNVAWTTVVPALLVAGSGLFSAQQALMYGAGLYVLGNVSTAVLGDAANRGSLFFEGAGDATTNVGGSMIAGAVVLAIRGESLF